MIENDKLIGMSCYNVHHDNNSLIVQAPSITLKHKLILKNVPGTNTPAYFIPQSVTMNNSFKILTPGGNVIKTFYGRKL
jgi:hypothetical protein